MARLVNAFDHEDSFQPQELRDTCDWINQDSRTNKEQFEGSYSCGDDSEDEH